MRILILLLFFASQLLTAQFKINGTIKPNAGNDWVLLYRIEGAKQVFINNTSVKTDTITLDGEKITIGLFEFELPQNSKSGSYRATYRLEGETFVDFFFNQEDVSFVFHPDYPNESITFSKSKDNILFQQFLNNSSWLQQEMDSLQVAYFSEQNEKTEKLYLQKKIKLDSVNQHFINKSKNTYIGNFIKANIRNNSKKLFTDVDAYMQNLKTQFYNTLDFTNQTLVNSTFLTDRILDYVFYLNYAEDAETQEKLYQTAVDAILRKITDVNYKKEIIEFLVSQFEIAKNVVLVDYLFDQHYKKLPENIQNQTFIEEKLTALAAEIGRKAADFSWQENGITKNLHALNDAETYVLVFYSTTCSHCMKEIPLLYQYLKDKNDIKVIAYALENDALGWEMFKQNLFGWHHVLGLDKWENAVARTYQIEATPTYFVLDKNKKIIAKPDELVDVKAYFEGR